MTPPHLPKLPSVQELLDHPRVRGVVARINRSTLAQRAGNYLEDLRDTLAKRAGKVDLPSLGHLAERFARRLFADGGAPGAQINATGLVVGDAELTPPLADEAVHVLLQTAGDFHASGAAARRNAEELLVAVVPGTAVAVFHSIDAALVVTATALAGGKRAVVLAESESAASACDWTQIAAHSGAAMRVHAVGCVAPSAAAAVFRAPESSGELAAWQAAGSALRIDVAPLAGLMDPGDVGLAAVPTIAARLTAGADAVIVDGAGLLSGPRCGIVVGKPEAVARCMEHPLAELFAAEGLVATALAATLRLQSAAASDPDPCRLTLPTWQLLGAPLDNLRQRSARLAALIGAIPGIASAVSRETPGTWGRSGLRELVDPTIEIAVRPDDGNPQRLAASLATAERPIATRRDGEELIVDLRSVFPRWDQDLIAAIEGA